ncbi:hypothetical protein ACFLVW_02275 [Chloroflexota bacterium]
MVKVQVSVTPNEAKHLIAKAISRIPAVCSALENGKILLKGGTTVSAIAEELVSLKMRISGRITQQGTKTASEVVEGFHRLLIEGRQAKAADSDSFLEETAFKMGKSDVFIMGANALDVNRRAAIMVAAPLGGPAGRLFPGIMARGVTTIIAVGWEKLIPCRIEDAVAAAGRETIDLAMGAAVGLVPLSGTVVTETDAISILAKVKATVIGCGGVTGGEGSTTFAIEGDRSEVKKAWEIVLSVKGAEVSGVHESLIECHSKSPRCASYVTVGNSRISLHRACVYRQPALAQEVFS